MAHPNNDDSEESRQIEDDYYAFLNLNRNASAEEITNAYRHLSRLYHPDKHTDPVRKKDAEILFNKTKTAYEVLSDPHKRAIYDTVGLKGLETEGWEIVQRTKTPQEIREEYERLAREREEQKLQQRTNPKGTISVGVDATNLFETYDYETSVIPNIEINNMAISQSIDAPLSISDTVTLNGNLNVQNGNGSGTVGCSLHHVISDKIWTEFEISGGNGLIFSMKGFGTICKRSFGTIQGLCQFTSLGIRPGLQVVFARQLDKHTVGYLTWKAGHQSSMNTMVVWDTAKGHFVGALQLGIPNSFLTISYTHKLENESKVKGSVKVGTFGAMVEYGCEKKISQHSFVGASVVVGIPSGVTLKLKVNRANQTYIFPILLSEELLPSAIFYATVTPLLGWYALKVLVIHPYQERQKKREAQKAQEVNSAKLAERRREAAAAVALMKETYSRIKDREAEKGGLVIIEALYGKLASNESKTQENESDAVVDVTIPLQCLVKDSHLTLTSSSKSNLPGFYDPCLDEEKSLEVKYNYRDIPHFVRIDDKETLRIPKDSHRLRS